MLTLPDLVTLLESHLLPGLHILAHDLRTSRPDLHTRIFSIRHHESFHALGLWSAPTTRTADPDSRDATHSLTFTILETPSALTATATLQIPNHPIESPRTLHQVAILDANDLPDFFTGLPPLFTTLTDSLNPVEDAPEDPHNAA